MTPKPGMRLGLGAELRPALLGRLRMADWIEMREPEFAKEIESLEKDPLFQKLYFGTPQEPGIIRRQRWPRGSFSSGFAEINERVMASGERVRVEEVLGEKAALLPKIRKMGQDAFERYFVHADEPLSLEEIARRTGLGLEDVRAIHDLLLELGAQEEFFVPGRDVGFAPSYSCIARLSVDKGEPEFEFFSAHWARGLYNVRYDLLEDWKREGRLEAGERRKVGRLLKRLETINLRQSTVYRILESLAKLQSEFLGTRDEEKRRPISLRQLARRLDLAPSTVSRALSGRSVLLPWGKEAPLITLLPGRRKVLRVILAGWLEAGSTETDGVLAERLRTEYGIRVSRRTVNAVRHELKAPRA
jgi:transcriptional regulator with XRE-family HTH domain